MELWADVYNAGGSRQGDGPILLRAASIQRVLDGVGSISVTVPGRDARAVSLLTNEARLRVYSNAGGAIRELGRGVIRRLRASGDPNSWSLIADGPDDLDLLTRVSTHMGRKFSNTAPASIVSSLAALVSGWSSSGSGGSNTDARFDGVSVWKAMITLAEAQGLHIRAGSSAYTVEIGVFGDAAGLRLVNPAQMHPALYANDDVALIERISVEQNSEAVATRIFPVGSGIGEAYLTLEKSTRTTPYTIQTLTNPDGSTAYYLENATATTAYGLIEKMGQFRQVAALSNSPGDVQNAANALYDVAAAWLTRYSVRQDVYSVSCRKVRQTIRAGDKIRMVYKGVVERDGLIVNYLNVDDDFWVMDATERAGVEGVVLDLKLSSIDRHEIDAAKLVIGAMEEITLDGVTVKPYFNRSNWVERHLIKPGNDITIPVVLSTATMRLVKCTMRVKTWPFTSVVAPGTALAAHRHTFFTSITPSESDVFYWRAGQVYDDVSEASVKGLIALGTDEPTSLVLQTGEANADDFASFDYDIYTDDAYPAGIQIWVNGTNYTASLSGPWGSTGATVDFTVDLTAALLAAATLQQRHNIVIKCTSGTGEIETALEVFDVISSIRGV